MVDVNILSVVAGDVTNAGMYLFYVLLEVFGSLIALALTLFILIILFEKLGLGNILKGFKK